MNSEDLDVDSKEITDGEANEDELDEPAVAPAPDGNIICYNLALLCSLGKRL